MNEQKILTFYFKDNNNIPNSALPLVVYKNVFRDDRDLGALWQEQQFKKNGWYNSWRNGVFPYHHYHSITHEVIGVYHGEAFIQFGGPQGDLIDVRHGDVIVIPAGVGHKNISGSDSVKVVGAYPQGMDYDIKLGIPGDYHQALSNLKNVSLPVADPVLGRGEGICRT